MTKEAMTKEAMMKDSLGKTDWDGRTNLKSLKQYERIYGKQFKIELDKCIALQKECKDNRKVWSSEKKQEKAIEIENQCGKSWRRWCN